MLNNWFQDSIALFSSNMHTVWIDYTSRKNMDSLILKNHHCAGQ